MTNATASFLGCHRIPAVHRARLPTVLESLDQFSRRMLAMTHISTSTRIKEDPSPACRAIGWRLGRRRMTRSQIAEPQYTLAGISIFSALPPNALETVHRRCSWRRYEQGEPIVDYLDASDDVFFVAAGEVCVTIYSLAGKAVSFRNLGDRRHVRRIRRHRRRAPFRQRRGADKLPHRFDDRRRNFASS